LFAPELCSIAPKPCSIAPKLCSIEPKPCSIEPKLCSIGPKPCWIEPKACSKNNFLRDWSLFCVNSKNLIFELIKRKCYELTGDKNRTHRNAYQYKKTAVLKKVRAILEEEQERLTADDYQIIDARRERLKCGKYLLFLERSEGANSKCLGLSEENISSNF
jgi:hypothetical protein